MLIPATELLPALPKAWHSRIVDAAAVPQGSLPPAWQNALRECDDPAAALEDIWGEALAALPQTATLLRETLQGYALLQFADDDLRLVYGFRRNGKMSAMVGHLPNAAATEVGPPLAGLPPLWKALYAIHDGWYAPKDSSRGHLPLVAWSRLDGPDWLLEPEQVARLSFAPEQTWLAYRHGGGGYLGFARNEAGAWQALELWSRSVTEPTCLANILARYDDWTAAHLEEMELRGEDTRDACGRTQ